MKGLFIALLVLVMGHFNADATIRRVGFFAAPVAGTDFSSYFNAYTAANAGDTILVFPGIPAINQTFTKKIITIGPGGLIDPAATPRGNAGLQAFGGTVSISSLTFNPGSEGSVVMGLTGGSVSVNANDITIRRNRDIAIYVVISSQATTTNNLQVLENYRVDFRNYTTSGSTVTNINFRNNFVYYFATAPLNTYSGNISNNVWAIDATLTGTANGGSAAMSYGGAIELGGGAYLFQNNILASYTNASAASNYNYFSFSNGTNTVFNNNMTLQANNGPAQSFGVGTGNIITPIANAANIFDGFPAIASFSADARYRLKTGSPALTVGAGNTAIGMFAGSSPYKLGNIPTIPTIYQLSSPQGNNPTGNTIQINVSTRGNN